MPEPRLHLILFNPEIPQNTGNIGRTCAFANARLHLIRPLGFELSDRYLKRSGMDYWQSLDYHIHDDWQSFRRSPLAPQRIWLLTTHAERSIWDASFAEGDGLLFGNEGHGCPEWLHREMQDAQRLRIPRFDPSPLRSLNLSTATAVAAYEALRQIELTSVPFPRFLNDITQRPHQ